MSALTDEERSLLRAAIREALAAETTLDAAREVLDGAPRRDDWTVAMRFGWPGLLVGERDGGAGLGAPEALLVMRELGRQLAGVPLFGHLMATALLEVGDLATGERRAAWLPVRPEADGGASVDPIAGPRRLPGPRLVAGGRVSAVAGWVPDAPGADLLVASATDPDGRRWTALIPAGSAAVQEIAAYDASRRLGHVRLEQEPAELAEAPPAALEDGWALAQALLGAEALGAAERLLEMSVDHARSRIAFGRAIGSFQAVKHQLVEVLRRVDLARALGEHAGAALATGADDAYTAACALRFSAGEALDVASRTAIAVHGGIGATWEHPASLYFRRAQVARRLLGGHGAAAAEVGRRLLSGR